MFDGAAAKPCTSLVNEGPPANGKSAGSSACARAWGIDVAASTAASAHRICYRRALAHERVG
jgi:hypothetical protein